MVTWERLPSGLRPIPAARRGCGSLHSAPQPVAAGIGLWRSLVAHLTGGQGVAGSNPVSPTQDLCRSEAGRGMTRSIWGQSPRAKAHLFCTPFSGSLYPRARGG
jgi:hypothetical protein